VAQHSEKSNPAHSTFADPAEMLGLVSETSSGVIADRVRQLLTTYNPNEWQGDLKP